MRLEITSLFGLVADFFTCGLICGEAEQGVEDGRDAMSYSTYVSNDSTEGEPFLPHLVDHITRDRANKTTLSSGDRAVRNK